MHPVSCKAGFGPGTSALQLAAGQGHVPVVRWGVDKTCPWSFVALALDLQCWLALVFEYFWCLLFIFLSIFSVLLRPFASSFYCVERHMQSLSWILVNIIKCLPLSSLSSFIWCTLWQRSVGSIHPGQLDPTSVNAVNAVNVNRMLPDVLR